MTKKKGGFGIFNDREVRFLKSSEVYSFLTSHPTSILFAGMGATADSVSTVIRGRFLQWREPPIPIVVVDTATLNLESFARAFVKSKLNSLGMDFDVFGGPPSGYYLFYEATPVAFREAINLQSDGASIAVGAVGLWVALATDTPVLARLSAEAATWTGAVRVADFFDEYLRKIPFPAKSQQQRPPTPPPIVAQTQLFAAYKRLGLPTSATDEEVSAVYKNLIKENHPDRCRGDAAAVAAANQRTAEINVARDTILGRPRGATAPQR